MKKCEILVTKEDGQAVAGTVTLKNGKVSVKPKKGYETLMLSVLQNSHVVDDEPVSVIEDSEAWFNALPRHYNGSRVRARML